MRRTAMLVGCGLVLSACGRGGEVGTDTAMRADTAGDGTGGGTGAAAAAPGESASGGTGDTVVVAMRSADGRELGTLTLAAEGSGIVVRGMLRGLPPGAHGIHIHETGRCEPPRFASAGSHWNTTQRQHGLEHPQGPHPGDLPNVEVGADSSATVRASTAGGTLRGANGLLDADGAAIVVHAGADDGRTQPSGASGAPIACGVVAGG